MSSVEWDQPEASVARGPKMPLVGFDRLQAVVEGDLKAAISELESQLGPVLGPYPPEEAKEEQVRVQSSLASLTDEIESRVVWLRTIASRLEL